MKEIKFRAWSKEHQIMMLPINQYGNKEPDTGLKTSSAGAFTRLWEALARFSDDGSFILMQSTTLKDKNGVDIYDGDILKDIDGTIGEVSWDGHFGCWVFDMKRLDWMGDSFKALEVVGNVYENPELLE